MLNRLNLGIVRQDIKRPLESCTPRHFYLVIYYESNAFSGIRYGRDFLQTGIEDVVFMTLQFPEDVIAHVQVSWLDPGKVRRFTIVEASGWLFTMM